MPLELSQPVIDGLLHLGVDIPMELSRKLIAYTVKMTLYPDASIPPDPEINAISSIKKSRSESAIVTLFALATKYCYDSQKIRLVLEQHEVNKLAIEELSKAFEDNRKEFFLQQLQIANTFPHITDVQWNIAADVKSSTSDCSSGELTFHINLGNYQSHTGQRDTVVEFLCNTEELQSLLNKLREIERHCENIANK